MKPTKFRPRGTEVDTVFWDGTNERARAIAAWVIQSGGEATCTPGHHPSLFIVTKHGGPIQVKPTNFITSSSRHGFQVWDNHLFHACMEWVDLRG